MDVCDLGGGSGPPRIHTGGAKNLWVKKNHHTRGERLKIATYNVRTLLKDEHVQELEEELKENNMKWDVKGSEKSDEKRKVSQLSKVATCCTTLMPTMDKQVKASS